MPAQAQTPTAPSETASVTAAADGTGTTVSAIATESGTAFTIEQGHLSADEINLFHSFDSFSLEAGDSADFLAPASVENILSRVSGGAPSVLNGLLQVTSPGRQAPNLYLMNPAGVLFGAEAVLNLPASFTVTTADAIGFEEGWFTATGEVAYRTLSSAPSGEFVFLSAQPGSVVNAGDLALTGDTHLLTLLGGTVVNTGRLSAPGGAITLAAIPGEQRVRLSQENNLLSLELMTAEPGMLSNLPAASPSNPALASSAQSAPLRPLDLPALLTQADSHHATGLSVDAQGQVRLTGSGSMIPTDAGDAIAAGMISVASATGEGGQLAVLGNRVGIFDAQLSASGQLGGGHIRLGGDYQGLGPLLTAQRTLVNDGSSIVADALAAGNGGRVIIWSDDTTYYARR